MAESERTARVLPSRCPAWACIDCVLPPRPGLDEAALLAAIGDADRSGTDRIMAALRLAYLRRIAVPVQVTRLRLGDEVNLLGLPGEPFVDYQLFAGRQARFTAVAGYGDTGTGYIPLARSHDEGGYEIEASSVSPASEQILKAAIAQLLGD